MSKKKFGDRRDGIKVRNVDGMHKFMLRFSPTRCESEVYINHKMDVTNLVKYMDKKKQENPESKFTYFHAFSTAVAKTIYNRPLLNRFVINNNYYDRNEVSISFVAKVQFTDESKENLTVLKVKNNDNINTINKKISSAVKNVRSNKDNKTDVAATVLGKLPNWLFKIVVGILKILDRHDLLPESLTGNLIYYSTVLMSNLGSIGCGSVYHHLTDFGTNSIVLTIGEIKKEPYVTDEGKVEIHDFCDFGITLDERIADGFYFAKSVKLLEYILNHPELLEENINEKIIQEEIKK